MQKTSSRDTNYPLTVNIETLAGMLDCGKATARKIAKEAGAEVRITERRVLYNVEKVKNYVDQQAK